MKTHITRNEIYRLFDNVHIINSKQIEELRKKGFNPIYYNTGTYGWNYDVYLFGLMVNVMHLLKVIDL